MATSPNTGWTKAKKATWRAIADLDADGDLDRVSIAYDAFNELHLWRNDSPHSGADTTPPTIANASAVSATTVEVVFSEPVGLTSAQTLGNYSINNGVTIPRRCWGPTRAASR